MSEHKEAIQLINEDKEFNGGTLDYFSECVGDKNVGTGYHVISVFGSQSSGKSTLLNKLFRTKFDTMDAQVKRQQTTKGIWLSHSSYVYNSLGEEASSDETPDFFVLDVEGSDGAERGEDQDFERKAALFALSVSEVLIVNMWENQVGLYQGNNMGLLKTVFEVNLSLFGKSEKRHKVALLFVIRDFTGQTPLESLETSLVIELEKMWSQLSKPKGCEETSFHDFFVPSFFGMGHKVFQPEQFDNDVKALGDMFVDKKMQFFKDEYHTHLPLEAWSLYAENCWEQIEHNKDLDLPTQQVLVARFKTDEIATAAYNTFLASFNSDIDGKYSTMSSEELASALKHLKSTCLDENYDPSASRYAKTVYAERRIELSNQLDSKINETIENCLAITTKQLLDQFHKDVKDKSVKLSFKKKIESAHEKALKGFKDYISPFAKYGFVANLEDQISNFETRISTETEELQERELDAIVGRFNKGLSNKLKESILRLLSKPTTNIWVDIMKEFNKFLDNTFSKYTDEHGNIDFQTGASQSKNESTAIDMKKNAWSFLDHTIHSHLTEDNAVDILRNIFINKFRYDDEGMPKFWKNEAEVDAAYRSAKTDSLKVLDALSIIKDSNNVEILVPENLIDQNAEDGDDYYGDSDEELGLYHQHRFSHVFSELQKDKIISKFKQFTDLTIIEAKRSIINTTERIPLYMYALVVALGWGKIMTILKNPATIFLSIIVLAGVYVIHKLNLWGPLYQFANQATGQATMTLKQTVRNLVLDEDPKPVSTEKYSGDLKARKEDPSKESSHL
ncbi:protein SEY1 [Kluyveromyces marxianus]|uniref:Protein SEY1 n=1 Tax=Kluyveromyces marxianus TaxID=4911 RepID=A0ABX6EUD1_KLUMA|nr:protein SEY1 [Kluyveromyces marxianus]